uniref:(northern house mosquito) hypothetical protein n=1 Tax=Culex pipiens TaxID=7175 RepID=A0A8D8AUV5_CULPI
MSLIDARYLYTEKSPFAFSLSSTGKKLDSVSLVAFCLCFTCTNNHFDSVPHLQFRTASSNFPAASISVARRNSAKVFSAWPALSKISISTCTWYESPWRAPPNVPSFLYT